MKSGWVFIIRKGFQTTQREEKNSGQGKPFSVVSALGSSAGTLPDGIILQHISGT